MSTGSFLLYFLWSCYVGGCLGYCTIKIVLRLFFPIKEEDYHD